MSKIIIIMGSKKDLDYCNKIKNFIKKFDVEVITRVASAHKVPLKVLEIVKEYEEDDVVFITVAGRSNALSGFVDAHTPNPVIASPPYSEKFGGVDIFSSLRMPSGVAPLTVLEPEQTALAALKILSMKDKTLKKKIREYQEKIRQELLKADQEVKNG